MFDTLPKYAPDPILALIDRYAADTRPVKIDLGVGVYKTDDGVTPVMRAVKIAEQHLIDGQTTKAYLGSSGNKTYSAALKKLIAGEDLHDRFGPRIVAFQSVGGTGALRLAAELVHAASPGARLWLGQPTWPNHPALFGAAGLAIKTYVYCAPMQQQVDMAQMLAAAGQTQPGDAFLIHACCHNPTGIDLSHDQVHALLDVLQERGATPLVDCAYAGFAEGLEQDLFIVRAVLERFDEAIVCFSCSKNFGIYRERTGAILVKTRSTEQAGSVLLGLSSIARSLYSMPPDHGSAAVAEILGSDELTGLWRGELEEIRLALAEKRRRLSAYQLNNPVLKNLVNQHGMFSLLPIDRADVDKLREDFGIYMTGDARINVLGVSNAMEPYLVESLSKILGQSAAG